MGNLNSRLQTPQQTSRQLEEYCKWKAAFLEDMREVVLQSEVKMIGEQDDAAEVDVPADKKVEANEDVGSEMKMIGEQDVAAEDTVAWKVEVAAPEEVPADKEPQTFDHYLDLPELVVRERILSIVHSDPQDLINLLEAIPSESKICMLTKEDLEFEMAFPEMLRTGAVSWTMERELRQLSFRSKHHGMVILKHFEKCLAKDVGISDPWETSSREIKFIFLPEDPFPDDPCFFDWREGEMSIEKWRQFPTTKLVVINWPVTLRVQEILAKFGEAAWDVVLNINVDDIRNGLQALNQIPNVRNLSLTSDVMCLDFTFNSLGPNARDLAAIELPELIFLNFLKLGVHERGFRFIWVKILKKYGPKLKQLAFSTSFSVPQFPAGSMPSFDALTMVNLQFLNPNHEEISSQVAKRFLSVLKTSPLKVLKINIIDRMAYRLSDFYSLLEHIANDFGSSLELQHLGVDFSTWMSFRMDEFVDYNNMPPPPNFRFPKLKHFETNLRAPSPDAWAFLCVFPALETLHIENLGFWGWYRNVDLEGISKELWRALPKLKWIQVSRQNVKITREQVLGTEE